MKTLLLLLLFVPVVYAQDKDWQVLGVLLTEKRDAIDAVYDLKTTSVVKSGPNTLRFWMRVTDYPVKSYELHSAEVNCKARTFVLLRIIQYSAAGKVIDDYETKHKAEEVPPDTLVENILIKVCRRYESALRQP